MFGYRATKRSLGSRLHCLLRYVSYYNGWLWLELKWVPSAAHFLSVVVRLIMEHLFNALPWQSSYDL